jgi:hypothetical protein
MRNNVTKGWRKQHNEEIHNLYSSTDIVIKSGTVKWAGHVSHVGDEKCIQDFGWVA